MVFSLFVSMLCSHPLMGVWSHMSKLVTFCRLTVCGLKWLTQPKMFSNIWLQQPWVQPGTPSLFLPTQSTSSLTPKNWSWWMWASLCPTWKTSLPQPTRTLPRRNFLSCFIAQEFWTIYSLTCLQIVILFPNFPSSFISAVSSLVLTVLVLLYYIRVKNQFGSLITCLLLPAGCFPCKLARWQATALSLYVRYIRSGGYIRTSISLRFIHWTKTQQLR